MKREGPIGETNKIKNECVKLSSLCLRRRTLRISSSQNIFRRLQSSFPISGHMLRATQRTIQSIRWP